MFARSNSTSITAPMHWTMVPATAWVSAMSIFLTRLFDHCRGRGYGRTEFLYRGRAAHDLRKLFGDRCLSRLVVNERELVYHVGGIVRRRFHRDHARGLLGGHVLRD